MNTITADSSLQQHLSSITSIAEVRAEDGRILGYFSPCDPDRARAYAEASTRFDLEEVERRKASGELGRTTAEVLRSLRELG